MILSKKSPARRARSMALVGKAIEEAKATLALLGHRGVAITYNETRGGDWLHLHCRLCWISEYVKVRGVPLDGADVLERSRTLAKHECPGGFIDPVDELEVP